MSERSLFILQRASAGLLAPFMLLHLLVILYAVQGGLTAEEILARTQGSAGWALFYGAFVVVVAVHAPIGLRNVLRDWTRWRGRSLDAALLALGIAFLAMGLRAVAAVVA
ncbi:MAG TPA: succinate dehydrogenase [Afifellaceae bacterium]|nr:succinate dehydrogenase [Afifellaceae bacterium]